MYPILAVSTIAIVALSFLISLLITLSYVRSKAPNQLFWSFGMWLFAICAFLETLFAVGVYSQFIIKLYLLLVAVLVELLAMGSTILLRRSLFSQIYAAYSMATTAFLGYALVASGSLGNLLADGVVFGSLPVSVTLGSVLITAPGATLLILISMVSFLKKRDPRILSIIIGVIVLSAGGTLYIATFPAFLYITEFVGVLLIWFGFMDFRSIFQKSISPKRNVTH